MKKIKYWFMFLIICFVLTACTQKQQEDDSQLGDQRLQIVTSFYPVYEFTQEVAGDDADVTLMIPAGTSVHDYEPSAQDLATLSKADVFIYANPEMEGWVASSLQSIDSDHLKIVETDEKISLIETDEAHEADGAGDHHHSFDPHTWLDPANALKQVSAIEEALAQADPENAEHYHDNAQSYSASLTALQADYEETFKQFKQTDFIVQHAAFGYLAARYDLTQHTLAGLSAENEASPQAMAEMVNLIQEKHIPLVYYTINEDNALAETVATEADVQTAPLHTLESLTAEEQEEGKNYISIMRDNLAAFVSGMSD